MESLRAGAPAGSQGVPAKPMRASSTRPATVRRPRLDDRFEAVRDRRLITVVAGAGFGKTTLLEGWATEDRSAFVTAVPGDDLPRFLEALVSALAAARPGVAADVAGQAGDLMAAPPDADPSTVEAIAGRLGAWLDQLLDHDLLLFIDDLHELETDGPTEWLVGALLRQAPARLHLVLGSRRELPFGVDRLRAGGDVADFGAADLALTVDEVAEVLHPGGPGDSRLAADLQQATGGWPAAVRLVAERIRGDPAEEATDVIGALRRPGGPLFAYLAQEVFEREPIQTRRLIVVMALLGRVTADLCHRLGIPDAGLLLESLVGRGLFVQRHDDGYVLHDLVRDVASTVWPLPAEETQGLLADATAWYREHGQTDEAIRLLSRAEDWPALADLIRTAGGAAVRSGAAATVVAIADRLPLAEIEPRVATVVGEAFASLGRSDEALAWLSRATVRGQPPEAGVAWRRAMSHYLRDELEPVFEIHAATPLEGADPADVASLLAWTACAARRLGDADRAGALADAALEAAIRADDDRALAAAHTAMGLVADIRGDAIASREHADRALAAAERAADLLQAVRLRVNRASALVELAEYEAAVDALGPAIESAEVAGFASLTGLGLMNCGLANYCLGRLEAASADYEASTAIYRSLGSRELAYAVIGRGDVYRERGDLELSRIAYEEGLAISERSGDLQGLVPGLYQLAKVLVGDDPTRAAALADRAVAYGWPDRPWALNAKGWVAWFGGDRTTAAECATEAADAAREIGDRFGLAEALELWAMASSDQVEGRRRLETALGIWESIGNELHAATTRLALARRSSGPGARAEAESAEARLRSIGVRPSPVGPAGLLTALGQRAPDPIEIRTLGGFRVLRDGVVVSIEEWRSRKARDLLKLLVTRRGRPIPRETLMEALWPDEDPDLLSNRLSVAISMLRSLLDPAKAHDADRFVPSDKATVGLDLDAVAVDIEAFFAHAGAGADLLRRRRTEEASERLAAAEVMYSGEFLEENPYDDWTVSLREEARSTYLSVTRSLAEIARNANDADAEIRYWLRLLERDPYDEGAALALVEAHGRRGALGEARNAYRRYVARMAEIEVEPAPFPPSASRVTGLERAG